MKNKLTSRQIQARETKNKIINSMWELLQEKTLDEITVNTVCKKTNISVGAFYHHFKTKEDVVYAAFSQFDELIEKVLVHKKYDSIIDAIIDVLYHEVIGAKERGIHLTAEIIKLTVSQRDYNVYDDENRFFHIYLKKLICEAKAQGVIMDYFDSDYITNLLLRHTRGIGYDWVAHQGNYDLEETIRNDIKLLLNNFINVK